MTDSNATQQLIRDADSCVKCGLCLPHCPTYGLHQHEADSPRGRIALAQGLASGTLQDSAVLQQHLDGCLACRACEAVCPAKVPYGRILDAARERIATPQRTRLLRFLAAVLALKTLRSGLRWLLFAGAPLLRWLPIGNQGWRRRFSYLPRAVSLQAIPKTPPFTASAPKVAVFMGCVSDVLERNAITDAVQILQALGVNVSVPKQQGCCGALYQHGGMPLPAAKQAAHNAAVFADADVIVALPSGCAASLKDLGDAIQRSKVQDLSAFIAARLLQHPLPLARMPCVVAAHAPCTQVHMLGAGTATQRMLGAIPQLTVMPLVPTHVCCGAAGSHFLSHPQDADALLAPKVAAAASMRPDYIVSANLGCSLHLASGLRRAGLSIPVIHPISLLAQAYRAGSKA